MQWGAYQVAWELACGSKADGNLGLKDLATINTSLLLKHVPKVFTSDSNPWVDWVQGWCDGGLVADDTPC
jgi:hypothetical protein